MYSTSNPPILLKQEKATPHSIAFKVLDMNLSGPSGYHVHPSAGDQAAAPEIKKRLESYTNEDNISREIIAEKLKRAEEKRKQALANRGGAVSPRIVEERRKQARERKRVIDEGNLNHLKEKNELNNLAEEKRRQTQEERRQRLRKHIEKVEERCREQAERRQSSAEKMKNEIDHKLQAATANRDETLDKVKSIAHYSAEKKKPGAASASGMAPSAYDNMPVPTHAPGAQQMKK